MIINSVNVGFLTFNAGSIHVFTRNYKEHIPCKAMCLLVYECPLPKSDISNSELQI